MVQPSRASELVEGLCIYSGTESFCPYRVVIGGCPPWFNPDKEKIDIYGHNDFGLILVDKVTEINPQTARVSFQLWGKKFVENRQPGWDWLCCPFRTRSKAAF